MLKWSHVATFVLLAGSAGCSFNARSPEQYRDDTAALLQTKNTAIKTCYDGVLRSQPGSKGTVTVRFKVEEETGRIKDIAVDPARTTAPGPVAECVAKELNGLVLQPPDARDGSAIFAWEFTFSGVRKASGAS
jgi:hypothetical protein